MFLFTLIFSLVHRVDDRFAIEHFAGDFVEVRVFGRPRGRVGEFQDGGGAVLGSDLRCDVRAIQRRPEGEPASFGSKCGGQDEAAIVEIGHDLHAS